MKTSRFRISRVLPAVFALLSVTFFGACQSYQFGNPVELPYQKIYVQPVANESFAPQAQALLSSQIREALIRDGRIQLVTSEEEADAILIVSLTEYVRQAAARENQDTVLARDFDLTLTAAVSLFDQNKGDYYFSEHLLSERSNAYVENPYADPALPQSQGFLQAEYQAMPRITRDLARKIADEVLSPWELQ